jgi:hypothetical protein
MFFQYLPGPGRIEQWAHFEYTFVLMLWATHLKFMYHVFSHEFSRARARHSSKPRRRPSRFTMSDDDGFLAEAASAGHDAAEAELLAMPPPLAAPLADSDASFRAAKREIAELRADVGLEADSSDPRAVKRARAAARAQPLPNPPTPTYGKWDMDHGPTGESLAFRRSLPSQPKKVGLAGPCEAVVAQSLPIV